MLVESALIAVNLVLFYMLARVLKLAQTGIFTLGFICIVTAILPHFGLYPIYMVAVGDPSIYDPAFGKALLLITCMLVGLLIGAHSTKDREVVFFKKFKDVPTPPNVTLFMLGGTLLATLILLSIFHKSLNPITMMESARSKAYREDYLEYNLSYPILILRGAIFFLHAVAVTELYKRYPNKVGAILGFLATCSVAGVTVAFGSRSTLFFPFLLFLFITHHFYKKIPWSMVIGIGIASIPLFVLLRLASTGWTIGGLMEARLYENIPFMTKEIVHRFSNFQNIVDFMKWFDHRSRGFDFTIAQIFVRPIPRAILGDKPPSLDVYLSYAIYGRSDTGAGSIHLYGGVVEMFYNFWYIGVLIWFFLLGRILYQFHFGTMELLASRRYLPALLIISNMALLRGLANFGINTITMQGFLTTLAAQLAVVFVYQMLAFPLRRKAKAYRQNYAYGKKVYTPRQTAAPPLP